MLKIGLYLPEPSSTKVSTRYCIRAGSRRKSMRHDCAFLGADVSRYSRFLYQRVRLLDKSVKVQLTADLLQENIAKEETSSIEQRTIAPSPKRKRLLQDVPFIYILEANSGILIFRRTCVKVVCLYANV